MPGRTNAGYEAVEQGTRSENMEYQTHRQEEGQQSSHKDTDSKDERSIANRLAANAKDQLLNNNNSNRGSGKKKTLEQIAGQQDPTLPAKMHGNKPSRGAKIDKSIEDEEAEILRRKEESKAAKKHHHH